MAAGGEQDRADGREPLPTSRTWADVVAEARTWDELMAKSRTWADVAGEGGADGHRG